MLTLPFWPAVAPFVRRQTRRFSGLCTSVFTKPEIISECNGLLLNSEETKNRILQRSVSYHISFFSWNCSGYACCKIYALLKHWTYRKFSKNVDVFMFWETHSPRPQVFSGLQKKAWRGTQCVTPYQCSELSLPRIFNPCGWAAVGERRRHPGTKRLSRDLLCLPTT